MSAVYRGIGKIRDERSVTLLFKVRFYNYFTEWIINSKKQELMIIKELFEGLVGDYCIARNTIKSLLINTERECDKEFQSVTHGGNMIRNLQSGLFYLLAWTYIVYRSLIDI